MAIRDIETVILKPLKKIQHKKRISPLQSLSYREARNPQRLNLARTGSGRGIAGIGLADRTGKIAGPTGIRRRPNLYPNLHPPIARIPISASIMGQATG